MSVIEGDDLDFLDAFHKVIFPGSQSPLTSLPHLSIGGFSNWNRAVGATLGLRNAGGLQIQAYCILDSDYYIEETKDKVRGEAARNGLDLYIWQRKEIENYVLVPSAIARFISSRKRKGSIDEAKVAKQIDQICESVKGYTLDQVVGAIHSVDRASGPTVASRKAREIVDGAWKSFEGKISICSGKDLVSALSLWAQKNFGVSFSALSIAREMTIGELDSEVIKVITIIENSEQIQCTS